MFYCIHSCFHQLQISKKKLFGSSSYEIGFREIPEANRSDLYNSELSVQRSIHNDNLSSQLHCSKWLLLYWTNRLSPPFPQQLPVLGQISSKSKNPLLKYAFIQLIVENYTNKKQTNHQCNSLRGNLLEESL